MKKILFFLIISLFFTSCSSKNNAFKYFEKDDIETKGIHYTKKIDIVKNEEIDIIFWATYLNKIDKDISAENKEVFFVSLYFANETGDGLVEETRSDVYYSSNVSMEKLIMEQLLEGPQTEGAKSAIPAGTKLINVSVVDGVCYVSLDENFKNQDYQVNEAVVIYSIVDSLTELSTISKVQISVNGDTSGTYRDNFKLSDMYDRNLDYVVSLEETGVTEEE